MVLEYFVPLIVGLLAHAASLLSLVIGIIVITALAITGTVPDYDEYLVEILQFDPETLRNRRLRLRPLPPQNRPRQDLTPPLTPEIPVVVPLPEPQEPEPLEAVLRRDLERRLRRQATPEPLPEVPEEPPNNYIVPPRD